MEKYFNKLWLGLAVISCSIVVSCKKSLDIPLPTNSVTLATAFSNKGTIDGLMNQMYVNLAANLMKNMAATGDYYSDNAYNPTLVDITQASSYTATSPGYQFVNWNNAYRIIYVANTLLEGLPGDSIAPGLTQETKKQYIAAAKTIRAYTYFHLVRFYGDVPLILTSNTDEERTKGRTPIAEVYASIEKDLKEAIADLPATPGAKYYVNHKYIPEAMLADVYLTQNKWAEAEAAATDIIASNKFQLSNVDEVFLQKSKETIMATAYTLTFSETNAPVVADFAYQLRPETNTPADEAYRPALSTDLLNSFEPSDLRRVNWVVLRNNANYPNPNNRYFTNKYVYSYATSLPPAGKEEEAKFYRLAEVLLIRAEARAQQNKITEAAVDLNAIRTRAGLPNTTASNKTDMVEAVLRERRVEFFSEKAMRWYDLVRTGKANAVLSVLPYKSANWKPYKVLLPLLPVNLTNNPKLTQNPGY